MIMSLCHASSKIGHNKSFIKESPKPLWTVLCTPLGWLLTAYIKHKVKENLDDQEVSLCNMASGGRNNFNTVMSLCTSKIKFSDKRVRLFLLMEWLYNTVRKGR